MQSSETIKTIKERIQIEEGTPPAKQRLLLDGILLSDSRTLVDYGNQIDLELAIEQRGGSGKAKVCIFS